MSLTESIIRTVWGYICGNVSRSLGFLVITLIAIKAVQIGLKNRTLPPGPWGMPFLGVLHFLKSPPHLLFTKWAKNYGSTFSFRLGPHLVVVLSDYKTIRTAFSKESFSGRPENQVSEIIQGFGVLNVEGNLWKGQRKFLHEHLRFFGMKQGGPGKEQLEARIMSEVEEFLNAILENHKGPLNMSTFFSVSISNVICSLLMSVRFSGDNARFKKFTDLMDEGFKLCTTTNAVNFLPILKHLPSFKKIDEKLQQNRAEMADFFCEIVEEHKKSFDPSTLRDMVDCYLLEIETAKAEGRADTLFEGKDGDRQIYQILGDMYSAGMETVKTTLNWAVLYMLHYPEVLKKVQEELDQVVGRKRLPSLADLPSLPYTEATLLEVLRRASIIPLGTTHCTTKNVILEGFEIPKNTQVIPLIYAVLMDDTLWDDPAAFNPSRFLNEDGVVIKPEYWLPFGAGRRTCLGEIIAKQELFLFFASLAHSFYLQPVEDSELPDMEGRTAVSNCPTEFELLVVPRQGHVLANRKLGNVGHSLISSVGISMKRPLLEKNDTVQDRRNAG